MRVPFYGSYTEPDPVKIAREGVAQFRADKYEIIIVDTSGRHKQETALFEEVRRARARTRSRSRSRARRRRRRCHFCAPVLNPPAFLSSSAARAQMEAVSAAVKPDDIVFVMDATIGQAAESQAKAFKASVAVGSVIISKLDGHAKGGGALSAVAATGSPITFVGSGEHFDDFSAFDANGFVSKLLGRGDMKSLLADMKDKGIMEDSEAMMGRAAKGKFTYRDLHEQYTSLMKLGSVSKLMEAIPGMAGMAGMAGPEGNAQFKMFIVIMQSMTKKELDCRVVIDQPRALRLARGAGVHPQAVHVLTEQLKQMSQMMTGINKSGLMKGGDNSLSAKMRRNPKEIQQKLGKNIDPAMLSKLGGVDNFMKLLGERATSFALAPCCVPPLLRRRATSARPARLPLHPLQAPAPTGTYCPRRRA